MTETFNNETVLLPSMVEGLLNEKGVGEDDTRLREAAKAYVLKFIEGWRDIVADHSYGITYKDVSLMLEGFEAGWNARLSGNCGAPGPVDPCPRIR